MFQKLYIIFVVNLIIILMFGIMTLIFSNESCAFDCEFSPFECGVMPFSETAQNMHVHFYVVGILFLIFDIELVLTMPLVFASFTVNLQFSFWMAFMFILISGLFMEIMFGSLDWKM
uniref:NADH-ubiquinone oxidoreductase chain 3 n=1 Tax=Pedicinus badii TaxID=430776 RepID=A0A7H1K1A7_9NEOP|nr:NADH dehydrogenase subunit 3 [Pedicinus badii]